MTQNRKLWILVVHLIVFSISALASNEILSIVCTKSIKTEAGECTNIMGLESLGNVLKELNENAIFSTQLKTGLSEYLDPKLIRIEFGSDLKKRKTLKKNFDVFIEKLDKTFNKIKDPEQKKELDQIRNLRLFSYQLLTRDNNLQNNDNKILPFGIESYAEASYQLINTKPFFYNKTIELLQISGMDGDCYGGLPVKIAGLKLTEFMNLCFTLNNKIKNDALITSFKKSCSMANAKMETVAEMRKFSYAQDIFGRESKIESSEKALGGIPQKIFQQIGDDLEDYDFESDDNLNLKAKIIFLNSAWSIAFLPIVEPILQDEGLVICVLSLPDSLDSSTDLTKKLYTYDKIQSSDIIQTLFNSCEVPSVNGFCPYFILKKQLGRLFLHYFLDPELTGFKQQNNVLAKDKFPELKIFNAKYNSIDNNELIERVFIWNLCMNEAITDEATKQATNEALKLKSLLPFFQENNIYLKPHKTFKEFKQLALNLFEPQL